MPCSTGSQRATWWTSVFRLLWRKVGCTRLRPAIWWSNELGLLSVSGPSLCSGLRRGTNYLHLCDRWTWHYKRIGANWRRTCSSSNCSGTSVTMRVWVCLGY